MAKKTVKKKKINLALQGGGAHGAFSWGVLDALLEDGRLEFDGVTATSAGALNAVALAHGLTVGDNETARETLATVWRDISRVGAIYSPVRFGPWDDAIKNASPYEEAFSFAMFEMFTSAFSPYQFNPLNINPLLQILKDTVDIEMVRKCPSLKIFITATSVRNGHPRVFTNEEITYDVVLASACIPFLYQSVIIEGEPYWDGGYVGNPSLWPLFYTTETRDICIVHINPIERKQLPTTSYDIKNRMNEITFNVSLLGELRSIAFVKKLLHQDFLKDEHKHKFKDILLHAIRADEELKDYTVASKFSPDWDFLCALRDHGRHAAKQWLLETYDSIGVKETVDIKDEFLNLHKSEKQKEIKA